MSHSSIDLLHHSVLDPLDNSSVPRCDCCEAWSTVGIENLDLAEPFGEVGQELRVVTNDLGEGLVCHIAREEVKNGKDRVRNI